MFKKDGYITYYNTCQNMSVPVYFDNANILYTPHHTNMYCADRMLCGHLCTFYDYCGKKEKEKGIHKENT